jgi:hypothetical protein
LDTGGFQNNILNGVLKINAGESVGSPECPCKHGIHTVDHLIFQCKRLRYERAILKSSALKQDKWPVSKSEISNRNLK